VPRSARAAGRATRSSSKSQRRPVIAESGPAEESRAVAPAGATGAAFFDLDRTLIAGSSAFEFARASYRAGLVSRRELASGAWANLRFRLQGSTDAGTDALRDRISRSIEGVRVRDLQRLGPDVLAGILPRVYRQLLEVAYAHQDEGRKIYICTAASHELAELLASVLAFDGGIGSRSEVIDGVYTGRPEGPFTYREGKAQAIRELATAEGIDLAASWAYSDSESDLPMLQAVGNPVAVNPDAELARIARDQGWEVMRFERLGRRLAFGGAAVTAAAAGGLGSVALSRRRPPPPRRRRLPTRRPRR
jgi:HAD superfamily hydrolase (TIGR01490 family)